MQPKLQYEKRVQNENQFHSCMTDLSFKSVSLESYCLRLVVLTPILRWLHEKSAKLFFDASQERIATISKVIILQLQ